MNRAQVLKAYRRLSPLYDLIYGRILEPGRHVIMKEMDCKKGQRVLEMGVGTGLSLPLYPPGVRITGIDDTPEMLRQARARLKRHGIKGPRLLRRNAMDLKLPAGSFDKVVAMYVATVVPDASKLVREMKRACKKGGDLYFVNYFRSRNRFIRYFEEHLIPVFDLLGFEPTLDLEKFVRDNKLKVLRYVRVNFMGAWTLIHARNS